MEIRDFARAVVETDELERKLARPCEELTDREPGEPLRLAAPGRPPELAIVPAEAAKVPKIEGMADRHQRARILHAFANHELQAVELFAWALIAFPEAPAPFRRGLLGILFEEQEHTRLYRERLEALGHRLGAFPVSGYFWNKIDRIGSPRDFICAMSLTFENANLDHTVDYAAAARQAGDAETAAVIDRIGRDEVGHVRFGWTWLEHFKDEGESMWEAYTRSLAWPLAPDRASGRRFYPEGRRAAGLDGEFIRRLEASRR